MLCPNSAVLKGTHLVLILKCVMHYHCCRPHIKAKLSSKEVEKVVKKSAETKRPRKAI